MIRKLMQSIREFKLFSLLSPLFVVLEVVMEVVIPILMAKLIDDGIDGSGGMDAVMHYGWILLVCCVLLPDFRGTGRVILQHLPLPVLHGICGTICSTAYRATRFPISISFQPPALSPV